MATTSVITGRILLPDNTAPINGILRLVLSGVDTDTGEVIAQAAQDWALETDGDLPSGLEVYNNSEGIRATFYRAYLLHSVADPFGAASVQREVYLGVFQLGDGDATANIQVLLDHGVTEAIGTFWTAISEADAEAVLDAADRAEAWAESATAPDPALPTSKSAKTWAGEAEADRTAAQAARDDAQGVLDDRLRKDVATLLADTTLTYTAAQPGTVAVGDIVRTRAEGFAYQVAASGASDHHVTTVGGVKLYVLAGARGYDVRAVGVRGVSDPSDTLDETDLLQAAFDAFDEIYLSDLIIKISDLVSASDKSIRVTGDDAIVLCSEAGGVDILLREGVDYCEIDNVRIRANGEVSGPGLHIHCYNSSPHGQPTLSLQHVKIDRQSVSSKFTIGLFLENVFQATTQSLHIRGHTKSVVLDSCVSVRFIDPDWLFADIGFETLHTNRQCEGMRFDGGIVYNNRIAAIFNHCIDVQAFGTHFMGSEQIMQINRVSQSSFVGGVWYCDGFDGTDRNLVATTDTVQYVKFSDITVQKVAAAIGHHTAFSAGAGFIQNNITACRFDEMVFASGANDNALTAVMCGAVDGLPKITDSGNRNRRIGCITSGLSRTTFGHTGNQLTFDAASAAFNVPVTLNGITEIFAPLDFHSGPTGDFDVRLAPTGGTGSGDGTLTIDAAGFRPAVGKNGVTSLGSGVSRWSQLFAVNGTISTSDAREKQDVCDLTEAERRVAVSVRGLLRKYRWRSAVAEKGDKARWHVGIMAQDVIAAFEGEGLDPFAYGVVCHDTWEAVDEAQEAGDRYGVRYDQLFAFILAAL
jgi:hypothetical protein